MTTYECYECPNRHCRAANSQEDRPGRCLFDEQREANWRKVKIYWVRPELPEPVARELDAARKKHPLWPVSPFHQVAVITEEVGELAQAVNDDNLNHARQEAAQVAAVAIRFLEGK